MIVVLGAGESGTGAALLARAQGLPVFVSDYGQISAANKAELTAAGIDWEEGGHSLERIMQASEIIKSPGIAETASVVAQALAQGISVIDELEFASRYSRARFIGITGTNGKTTTTLLTYHLLKESGLDVGLGGNVGKSLARQIAAGEDRDWFVLEISSFQLDGLRNFRAEAGVLLNVTVDHMDRYQHSMELYAASKYRIWQNQQPDDWAIAYAENEYAATGLAAATGGQQQLLVSTSRQDAAAWLAPDKLVFNWPQMFEIPLSQLPVRGAHNYINCMCAVLAALKTGLQPGPIIAAIGSFVNAPHRLEPCGRLNNVAFVNDSKATNVDAVLYALQSFSEPLVLILGGKDKGNDYAPLAALLPGRVKAIVAMGKDNSKITSYFQGQVPLADTHSVDEAVQAAWNFAAPGDVVLLSPACASFDLFNNYEHRGELFKQGVAQFIKQQQG